MPALDGSTLVGPGSQSANQAVQCAKICRNRVSLTTSDPSQPLVSHKQSIETWSQGECLTTGNLPLISPIVLMLDSFVACDLRDARVQRLKKASITCVVLDKGNASHPWARLLRLDETGDIETRAAHMDFGLPRVLSLYNRDTSMNTVLTWYSGGIVQPSAFASPSHANCTRTSVSRARRSFVEYIQSICLCVII